MPIERVFLDWRSPGLVSAVDYLAEQFGSTGVLELQGVVVAVPGGRAGRRLLEILVDRAEREHWTLIPPSIVTVGNLPETLYEAKRPFAEDLVQQLAWIAALRSCQPDRLGRLIPDAPPEEDLSAWLSLAAMLMRLHQELARDALDFKAVADGGSRVEEFREQQRWITLAGIQERYLEILDGLGLWDRQTARLFAIREGECRTDRQIVLVGLADMNQSQRRMLDQVAEQTTALIFAPDELSERFDEYGCLKPETWQNAAVDLATEQIEVVDGPADQAAAVVRAMASFDGRYAAEQITVGVPDERIVPHLMQHLGQSGVSARYGAGVPVARSAPYRLLEAVAGCLDGRSFAALAALVRHPDVHAWLADRDIDGDWLTEMDNYHSEHLPYRAGDRWLGEPKDSATAQEVHKAIEDLLDDMTKGKRPLGHWQEKILDLLVAVLGRSELEREAAADRALLHTCEKIRDVLQGNAAVPEELVPSVTGADALQLLLQQVGNERIAPLPDRDAVELLGWLELPLDDAPALIVTGLNEGLVPGSVNADLFLPNQLRRALGIDDNDRRYARDAYALGVLAASRRELRVIAGRRTADADPLTPSRLLFACDDLTAAGRARSFFSPPAASSHAVFLPGTLRPARTPPAGEPPRPQPLPEPVRSMRVTEFRDYLACPYRYYLRHRLKLRGLSDSQRELDGAAFGSLAHDVLRSFGKGTDKDSTDAETIAAYLDASLDHLVREQYGDEPLPAVRVQVEQLRRRLREFANWQAAWFRDGWRIEHVEAGPEDGQAALEVDGKPMILRGRIDRIDVHESTGRRLVLDYKTSDRAKTPEQTHREKGKWVDLQLPLYRHLARAMVVEGPIELGYVVLPKDVTQIGYREAGWSDEELDSADAAARDVIRSVRAGEFWPPATPPPAFFEEFAAICGDDQLGSMITAAEEQGENGP